MTAPPCQCDTRSALPHPVMGMAVTGGGVALRIPDDTMLVELADLLERGDAVPADKPHWLSRTWWSRGLPTATARRSAFCARHWQDRAQWGPGSWTLGFAIVADGRPVGMQAIRTKGQVYPWPAWLCTSSWLSGAYQGRGIGTRARALVAHAAFEVLGAQVLQTTYAADNAASAAVSAKLGYVDNGMAQESYDGRVYAQREAVLERDRWYAVRPDWVAGAHVCAPTGALAALGLGVRVSGSGSWPDGVDGRGPDSVSGWESGIDVAQAPQALT